MSNAMRIIGLLAVFLTVSGAEAAPIIWDGPAITYTQPGRDPTLPQNQDRLTDAVWITRGSSQGLFNAAQEVGYTHLSSPADTEWAYGSAADWQSLVFKDWEAWFGGNVGGGPASTVNKPAVLHLISDDIYLDIEFLSIGSGGGFSYTRSTAAVPEPAGAVLLSCTAIGLMIRARRRRQLTGRGRRASALNTIVEESARRKRSLAS